MRNKACSIPRIHPTRHQYHLGVANPCISCTAHSFPTLHPLVPSTFPVFVLQHHRPHDYFINPVLSFCRRHLSLLSIFSRSYANIAFLFLLVITLFLASTFSVAVNLSIFYSQPPFKTYRFLLTFILFLFPRFIYIYSSFANVPLSTLVPLLQPRFMTAHQRGSLSERSSSQKFTTNTISLKHVFLNCKTPTSSLSTSHSSTIIEPAFTLP